MVANNRIQTASPNITTFFEQVILNPKTLQMHKNHFKDENKISTCNIHYISKVLLSNFLALETPSLHETQSFECCTN
jgi:hypothetical protein